MWKTSKIVEPGWYWLRVMRAEDGWEYGFARVGVGIGPFETKEIGLAAVHDDGFHYSTSLDSLHFEEGIVEWWGPIIPKFPL